VASVEHPGRKRIPAISPNLRSGFGASPRQIRLRGIVRTGVERGSIVLLDHDGKLLAQLMGGDPAIVADGLRVIVTGHFVTGLLTTAQQGAPFRVLQAVTDPA
jgi:hypothetical protein